jgi:hypothetical protein
MATNKGPGSYGDAILEAGKLLRQGQRNDPGEHFPYKHDDAWALREENPPAGPLGPDDDRLRVEDYISFDIIDASSAYVAAMADYLEAPSEAKYDAYHAARDELVAARLDHRSSRVPRLR